jgi:D-alanyl-lipoteichoic acid acyltransferase DltB (MBOAT superfamily)
MQFDTATYVVFLTLVVGLYWTLRGHSTARVALLLAASFLFYGWWDARFLVLIVASTVLDYWVGARLHRSESTSVRRRYLFLSILGNLGVLSFFKYTNFLAQSVLQIGSWWSGEAAQFDPYSILLPVGISFYTFQSMSYTIDIYRRRLQPVNSFLQFALFVAFFPQLVAGPIVRARNFLPQLKGVPRFAPRRMSRGLSLILVGLVKKVAFADALGTFVVDRVFLAPEKFQALDALFAAYAYSFQI